MSAGAPPSTYGRPSVAYVTPSRRATRTALSNSSSANQVMVFTLTINVIPQRFQNSTITHSWARASARSVAGLLCVPHPHQRGAAAEPPQGNPIDRQSAPECLVVHTTHALALAAGHTNHTGGRALHTRARPLATGAARIASKMSSCGLGL